MLEGEGHLRALENNLGLLNRVGDGLPSRHDLVRVRYRRKLGSNLLAPRPFLDVFLCHRVETALFPDVVLAQPRAVFCDILFVVPEHDVPVVVLRALLFLFGHALAKVRLLAFPYDQRIVDLDEAPSFEIEAIQEKHVTAIDGFNGAVHEMNGPVGPFHRLRCVESERFSLLQNCGRNRAHFHELFPREVTHARLGRDEPRQVQGDSFLHRLPRREILRHMEFTRLLDRLLEVANHRLVNLPIVLDVRAQLLWRDTEGLQGHRVEGVCHPQPLVESAVADTLHGLHLAQQSLGRFSSDSRHLVRVHHSEPIVHILDRQLRATQLEDAGTHAGSQVVRHRALFHTVQQVLTDSLVQDPHVLPLVIKLSDDPYVIGVQPLLELPSELPDDVRWLELSVV
mmetsp:Transcript_20308/g.56418  ORF Transcript_20308/g.56418 Transcript_20308/m.56418 type:complete len:397 (-) Transcript_20308:1057-2247(-)